VPVTASSETDSQALLSTTSSTSVQFAVLTVFTFRLRRCQPIDKHRNLLLSYVLHLIALIVGVVTRAELAILVVLNVLVIIMSERRTVGIDGPFIEHAHE
jgi:hypothetical protein